MLPDRVSNPRPLTYESDALPIALRGLALKIRGGIKGNSIFLIFKRKHMLFPLIRTMRQFL